MWTQDVQIQLGDVVERTVSDVWFWDQIHAGEQKRCMVKMQTRNARYGPLLAKSHNLLQQTCPENPIDRQSEQYRPT